MKHSVFKMAWLTVAIVTASIFTPAYAQEGPATVEFLSFNNDPQAPLVKVYGHSETYSVVLTPLFDSGIASDDEVAKQVGQPTFSMENCEPGGKNRRVEVKLGPGTWDDRSLVNNILRNAAVYAWRECPSPKVLLGDVTDFFFEIDRITLILPDGETAFYAEGLRHPGWHETVLGEALERQHWTNWQNLVGLRKEQEAQAASQAAQAEQQRVAANQRAAQQAAQQAANEEAGRAFFRNFKIFLLLLALVFVWLKRGTFLRWFYLLTPHPAAAIVDRALYGGNLDIDAFTRAIHGTTGENQYERAVRTEQLGKITERWRAHEGALRESEARVVDSERRKMEKENELFRAQAEALEAAIAHEKAAARFEELQRSRR